MNTKVSVITPCYNQCLYIKETIESVVSQTYTNWEMIIIDDGSSDDSYMIAYNYSRMFENIHVYKQTNGGPAKARNYGVSLSKGDLLLFLDGDDLIEPNYMEYGVSCMDNNNNCSLFYTKTDFFGDKMGLYDISYSNYKELLLKNSIVCCCIIRRCDFDRVNGFDESMRGFEDWEFFIRLLYHAGEVCQHEQILFHYRKIESQQNVNHIATCNREEITLYIYKKHINKYFEYFYNPQILMATNIEKEKQLQWYINWNKRLPIRLISWCLRCFDQILMKI